MDFRKIPDEFSHHPHHPQVNVCTKPRWSIVATSSWPPPWATPTASTWPSSWTCCASRWSSVAERWEKQRGPRWVQRVQRCDVELGTPSATRSWWFGEICPYDDDFWGGYSPCWNSGWDPPMLFVDFLYPTGQGESRWWRMGQMWPVELRTSCRMMNPHWMEWWVVFLVKREPQCPRWMHFRVKLWISKCRVGFKEDCWVEQKGLKPFWSQKVAWADCSVL